MSTFAPSTRVILCNVPIDKTQVNQIKFASVAAQTAYFLSKKVYDFSVIPQTFVRVDTSIKVDKNIDELFNCNYVMYDNNTIANKWIYCFISKMEYVSSKCTKIYIETDVFQTWFLQCTVLPCFVSREHIAVDDVGKNLIDEGLETGEYVSNRFSSLTALNELDYIVMSTMANQDDNSIYVTDVNGIRSSVCYLRFDSAQALQNWIGDMTSHDKLGAILGIFSCPKAVCKPYLTGQFANTHMFDTTHYQGVTDNFIINTDIDGYVPKNLKVYQYPYNYLYVTTFEGSEGSFKWEYCDTPGFIKFQIDAGIQPNPVVKLTAIDYKKQEFCHAEALSLANFPPVPFINDAFQAYIAANAVSLATNLGGAALSTAIGVGTGNIIAGGSGLLSIGTELGQVYQHSIEPKQINGTVSGNANIGQNIHTFHFYCMSVTAQRAKIIDDYFTMYGYKTQQVKKPNLTGRPVFNYVKTIDANITGSIPNDDMEKLKNIFNNGVTLWHNGNNVGHYELDNRAGN